MRLTRVAVYKAVKDYKGENLLVDLTCSIYLNTIEPLTETPSKEVLHNMESIQSMWHKEKWDKAEQTALNHLRCFKVLKMKHKTLGIK